MKIIDWSKIGPIKVIVKEEEGLQYVQGQTLIVTLDGAFPEDIEQAILWVLTREWRGFYFTFANYTNPYVSTPETIPQRAILARTWFSIEELSERKLVDVRTRIVELIKTAEAVASPSSFLLNLCNRDLLTSTVHETHHEECVDTVWLAREG